MHTKYDDVAGQQKNKMNGKKFIDSRKSRQKQKPLKKFWEDFEVKSCYGHIRDLEKDDMGIDINNNYAPRYIVPEEKQKVVKELKQLAKKSDEVWLATDEDREGEAISWHLCEVLGLDPQKQSELFFMKSPNLLFKVLCKIHVRLI